MGMHRPDGRHPLLDRVVDPGLRRDRRGLGHPVADRDFGDVHPLAHLLHHLHRAGRPCHDAGAKRREVGAIEVGVVELRDKHGRDAVERRAAFRFNGRERASRIEPLAGHDDARPVAGTGQIADDHAEAVVERHRHAHPIDFGVAEHLAAEEAVVQDVVVRQRRALGRAGGAGCVLDVDRVVERQAGLARRQPVVVDRLALVEQCRPLAVENHSLPQRGALGADPVQNLHVVGLPEPARQQQQRQPRLCERVTELLRLVGGIDVDQDRADPGGGVLDDDPLEAVGGPDADPVPLLDATRQQRLGQRRCGVPELSVGGPILLGGRHQRVPVAKAIHGASEIGADRLAQKGDGAGAVHVGRQAHVGWAAYCAAEGRCKRRSAQTRVRSPGSRRGRDGTGALDSLNVGTV